MTKYTIWSNIDLNLDDWQEFFNDEYPEMSDDERYCLMEEMNDEHLADERSNLNITMDMPIIAIGDIGRWNGRRMGYKDIESGKIRDCLYTDCDYATWYIDERGDLCCTAHHHDGTNFYTYRVFKRGVSETQMENLKYKLYMGTATRKDITRVTERLGDAIANVYGWKIRKIRHAA